MKSRFNIITYLILLSFLKCNSQNEILLNPDLEFSTRVGEKGLIEKDLSFIKGILDNDLYSVQRYSFLPEVVFSENKKLIFFDKFSLNLIEYDPENKKIKNIFEISDLLKSIGNFPDSRIELIDVSSNSLSFYSLSKKELIHFDRSNNEMVCRTPLPTPLFLMSSHLNRSVEIYTYNSNYKLTDCTAVEFSKNKNIPANSNELFLKHDSTIYYQALKGNSIVSLRKVNQSLIVEQLFLKGKLPLLNFNLVHINDKYFVLASDPEEGLGKLIFFEKNTGNHFKTVSFSSEILSNEIVDFYSAISDYPSPDTDESMIYIRIASINDKYYLMLQSDSVIKLYSFQL